MKFGAQVSVRLTHPHLANAIYISWYGRRSGVYTDFVDRYGICEGSASTGLHFLEECTAHGSWSHIWERLWDSFRIDARDTLREQGRNG